jgi:hypothetical protein
LAVIGVDSVVGNASVVVARASVMIGNICAGGVGGVGGVGGARVVVG